MIAMITRSGSFRGATRYAFRTGMRKGEIARLTWDMLDRTDVPWVLRIPGAITKNRTGRTLGLEGEVKAIIEPSRPPGYPQDGSSTTSGARQSGRSSARA